MASQSHMVRTKISAKKNNFFSGNIAPNHKRETIFLQILQKLIEPSMFRDPLGLSTEGVKQRLIGKKIDDFRLNGRTLIEASHVPGHVKGVRPGTASYLHMETGALLYQYVKPVCTELSGNKVNGYIGTYFSLDPTTTPDNLGIHHEIIDPGTGKRIQRQKVCFYLNQPVTTVISSTAKKIIDNFSIKGESHVAQGGAQQYFLGIYLNNVSSYLTIIITEDLNEEEKRRINAISQRNNVSVRSVTPQEFLELQRKSAMLTPLFSENIGVNPIFLENPQDNMDTLLAEVLSLVKIDKCKSAIKLLEVVSEALALIEKNNKQSKIKEPAVEESKKEAEVVTLLLKIKESKAVITLLLSCLYAMVGDEEASAKKYKTYTRQPSSIKTVGTRLYARLILARSAQDSSVAIRKLDLLLNRINSTSSIDAGKLIRLKILTLLELGKRVNRLYTASIPYITTYSDMHGITKFAANKNVAALKASNFLAEATNLYLMNPSTLYPQEVVHLYNQSAYAAYNLGHNKGALEKLTAADKVLDDLIKNMRATYAPAAIEELELLLLAIKMRLYLILSKLKKEDYPSVYENINPQKELLELMKNLRDFDHMLLTLMVEKLLAMDASDYHITGWTDHGSLRFAGADFVSVIRAVVPLDLSPINLELAKRESDVKSLDIAFLGLEPPCGIEDNQCDTFLAALKENTSLESLVLRKFSVIIKSEKRDQNGKKEVLHSNTKRIRDLLEILTDAQEKGMELKHFSYDGSRFSEGDAGKEEMEYACQFIENNTSLRSFFPDLYDWTDDNLLRRFAEALKNHPTLEVLYTGIWEENPRAGQIMYEALKDREKPLKIVLHHYVLAPKRNPKAIENNNWLQKLNDVGKETVQEVSRTASSSSVSTSHFFASNTGEWTPEAPSKNNFSSSAGKKKR